MLDALKRGTVWVPGHSFDGSQLKGFLEHFHFCSPHVRGRKSSFGSVHWGISSLSLSFSRASFSWGLFTYWGVLSLCHTSRFCLKVWFLLPGLEGFDVVGSLHVHSLYLYSKSSGGVHQSIYFLVCQAGLVDSY